MLLPNVVFVPGTLENQGKLTGTKASKEPKTNNQSNKSIDVTGKSNPKKGAKVENRMTKHKKRHYNEGTQRNVMNGRRKREVHKRRYTMKRKVRRRRGNKSEVGLTIRSGGRRTKGGKLQNETEGNTTPQEVNKTEKLNSKWCRRIKKNTGKYKIVQQII